MEFSCKVGAPSGEVVEKTFTADDEAALRVQLEQQGYYLFSIQRPLSFGQLGFLRNRRVPTSLLIVFGQELSALLKAGLPLFQSLDVMLERQKDPVFRRSLHVVRDKVKAGTSLSDAIQAEGDLYPPIFAATLVAGERSGSLEIVLRRFVQYLRLNQTLKRKAITASVYPLFLVAMMMVIVMVLVVWVIPMFKEFVGSLGGELPLQTRLLMGFSVVIRSNIYWIAAIVIGALVGFRLWSRRPGSEIVIDALLLRIPYIGHLMRMFATSQLARTLSTLLSGGLPLLNALEVAAASIGNRAMASAVAKATPNIREGKSLTTALESTRMVEELALEMVKVGEQTGALGDMLGTVAEFYDEELDTRLAILLAMVEPVILVFIAALVAMIILSIYLPLFQAASLVRT